MVERPPGVLVFVIVVREEDVREVDLAARDINQLESVDEGFIMFLEVVVVGRANDGGKGLLGFREETFSVLRVVHFTDDEEKGAQGLVR